MSLTNPGHLGVAGRGVLTAPAAAGPDSATLAPPLTKSPLPGQEMGGGLPPAV